ncbi:dephospho-CoA kinase [Acidiferrobacter sp. SPIII_3]|jgi:dephospho-CoA kinase|uniref:dephospho-CoA kinase n=1 Tax=Acidiferrobacter sp. SPIII_3 TaxID=1281578 RepID=UPI000D73C820|nr:dephospho-CoA kinase [Acidiferrobacter sp. SPIII_3]AWP22540.1 dephospho-CoA kinase [Acidiferrobacter sp. SPIII_3]
MASYRVALTGGAGAGKSAAAQVFAECGAVVVDADQIAHELLEPGQACNAAVRTAFDDDHIADSEGRIVRPRLRERVFSDPRARKTLEAILHPPIQELMRHRSEGARPYAVLVIPLLAETGRPPWIDRVLVIDAEPPDQRRRLQERGLDAISIERLLAIQASPAVRRALADDILENTGSLRALAEGVRTLHARYRTQATP